MNEAQHPLVSIGVPVFNGEKGLAKALDSLLEQDYDNLEIIISDNASTDATPDICADYVRKDSRIKYFRSLENVGGANNFNRVFELSIGQFFMWAAHDDQRQSSFVRECVEKFERSPGAVLCAAHTHSFIQGESELLYTADLDSFEGLSGLVRRYRETLKHFPATAIYGVFRSSALRKTRLFARFLGADLAMIQELSIHGDFVQVKKSLFTYYGRETWNSVHDDHRMVFGDARKPWWHLPFLVLFLNNCKRVADASLPVSTKCGLWAVLVAHEAGQIALKMLIKSAGRICPAKYESKLARQIYWRWMHSPNVKVGSDSLFYRRVILPRLGWAWRASPVAHET